MVITFTKGPQNLNGKEKVFEEIFYSPFEKDTQAEAMRVLDAIREGHPESSGWVEFTGTLEKLPNGKWRAVRHHAQYK